MSNITVLVTAGTTGLLIVNMKNNSTFTNVSITINHTMCPAKNENMGQINGIVIYCDHWNKKHTIIVLDNFQFSANESCSQPLQYAITLLLPQNNTKVIIIIKNTIFKNLRNVSALYYHGETCGVQAKNKVVFVNCIIFNNTGILQLFEIHLCNLNCLNPKIGADKRNQQYNNFTFVKCRFINNHNITSIIHVTPVSSRYITGYIYITNSSFCNNINTHFLILESDRDSLWQTSNYIRIETINISSNRHSEGYNLLSATNCVILFMGNVVITNNSLFENIIKIYISFCFFQHNITITNNTVRQIYYGSFIIMREDTILNISFNTVYMITMQSLRRGVNSKPVCKIQFQAKSNVILDNINVTKLPFKIVALNNTHMTSKKLLGKSFSYTSCQWLQLFTKEIQQKFTIKYLTLKI